MSVAPEDAAAGGRGLRLADLTWQGVRAAVDGGTRTVILPLGATEQHGPALPLSVDSDLVTLWAEAVAERLGDALVAPTLALGCSDHHLSFPGTISLSVETAAAVIRESVRSLAGGGFDRFLLLTGHLGNRPAMALAAERLAPLDVRCYAERARWLEPWDRVAAELGIDRATAGSHAGHAETSLMLHFHQGRVRRDRLVSGFVGDPAETGRRLAAEGMAAVSPLGVVGDPRSATAEAGRRYFEVMVDSVVAFWRGEG